MWLGLRDVITKLEIHLRRVTDEPTGKAGTVVVLQTVTVDLRRFLQNNALMVLGVWRVDANARDAAGDTWLALHWLARHGDLARDGPSRLGPVSCGASAWRGWVGALGDRASAQLMGRTGSQGFDRG